jgi:type IV pilus assembly protein PilC
MKKFSFKAKEWGGKSSKGLVEAASQAEALTLLKSRGLIVVGMNEVKKSELGQFINRLIRKVSLKQIVNFTRQLSTMMNSGLPLTDSLNLLKSQFEGAGLMEEVIERALDGIQSGSPLAKSLEPYNRVFGEAYVATIAAGEEGGVLEKVLEKLADNLEGKDEFQGKVKGAMIYPTIVIIGMIAVMFVMMIFVLPKLMELYSEFGSEMPMATQILMGISNFAIKTWFLLPVLIFGAVFGFKMGMKNPKTALKIDGFKLKIPIFGRLTEKTVMAEVCRTLGMLLGAGISLVEALNIVANSAGNYVYTEAFRKAAERVEKGFTLADAIAENPVFPVIVAQMTATGEETGKLDEILFKVSKYFATEAEQGVKALTSAIEPLIMIVLGIGVGFLVIAIVMPIYNLTAQF